VKHLCSFNQVYSMMPFIKLSEYLCENATGENRVGNKQRGRERERKRATDKQSERQSNG
jgi:hypothetical protein